MGYVGSLLLLHLEGEAVGRAVEAEVVAAGQHEDVLGDLVALDATLGLVGVHNSFQFILKCITTHLRSTRNYCLAIIPL